MADTDTNPTHSTTITTTSADEPTHSALIYTEYDQSEIASGATGRPTTTTTLRCFGREFEPRKLLTMPSRQTFAYCFSFIGLGISVGGLGPTLLDLGSVSHTEVQSLGWIFTLRGLGALSGSLAGGRLFDSPKLQKRANLFMVIAIATMLVALAVVPLLSRFWLQCVAFYVQGFGFGVLDNGANVMLGWIWRERAPPFMQLLHFCFGAGAFIGPMIVAEVVKLAKDRYVENYTPELGLYWSYWSLGIITALTLPPFIRLDAPLDSYASEETNDASNSGDASEGKICFVKSQYLSYLLIAGFLCLYVGGEVTAGGWIYTFGVTKQLATESAAAYMTSLFWGSLALGRLVGVPLAAYFNSKTLLLMDLAGCFVSAILWVSLPNSVAVLWYVSFALGFFMASVYPATMSLPTSLGIRVTGKALSLFVTGASLGEMAVPAIVGSVFKSLGPNSLCWTILLDIVGCGMLYVMLVVMARFVANRKRSPTADVDVEKPSSNYAEFSEDEMEEQTTQGEIQDK